METVTRDRDGRDYGLDHLGKMHTLRIESTGCCTGRPIAAFPDNYGGILPWPPGTEINVPIEAS